MKEIDSSTGYDTAVDVAASMIFAAARRTRPTGTYIHVFLMKHAHQ